MRKYIKKLQSKSENTRKQIFVGSMIVCMSLVGLIWIGDLSNNLSNQNTATKVKEDIKPFSLFGKVISDTVGNISASVGSVSFQKETPKNEPVNPGKVIDLIPVETQ